jgi:hypothetical protein
MAATGTTHIRRERCVSMIPPLAARFVRIILHLLTVGVQSSTT